MKVLTPAQRQQFEDEGYVVVDQVLDPAREIAPVMDEFSGVLDDVAASLRAEGAIASTYPELSFSDRLTRICAESGRNFPDRFDISLPFKGVQRDTPIHLGPSVFRLMTSPRLLDAVEDIIGPEIFSNPVQHVRMKLPRRAVSDAFRNSSLMSKTGWHQDIGVILEEADVATILTVWIPLSDATEENGCLEVIPGSHRNTLIEHCSTTGGMRIPDILLPAQRSRPLPMPAGSVILMNQQTVHASLDNVTEDQVRLSFDLRYQPIGQPTGRPAFPGFVARSAAHPETVLSDPAGWARLWLDTRERLARIEEELRFTRWNSESAVCA
ncbi:MAG: phytanoyl-CoA dioxygenase family protein [Chloroflexi bacterium]|nr:phytanoyl-CoA dioxygenase family protein [Chloroflexota bacterium]